MLALRGGRSRARAAGSAGQPCWAGCARGRCGPGIAMAPSVPLLLGLVFCRDPGIWAQTDLPEVYQNPLEETALPVVSGSSAIGLLPLLFVLLFILCLCCCGGQHGSADNETKSQLDFNSSNPGMDFSEENPRKRSEKMTSRCTSCWRRTDRRTCTPTPRNAHGGLLSPPLSRTRTPSRRVSFHCRLAALKSPQYSPTWTHLPLIWSAERELAVCTPWRKCPLRSVGFHGVDSFTTAPPGKPQASFWSSPQTQEYRSLVSPQEILGYERWNISCRISEQRISQSQAMTATADGELVSPEGTQEGKSTAI
ncbi:uncharacterized protein LOC122421649 isoform X1 [Cervus canadensis]|uniref:uncharacterized protein LOC122421649 isoform X1 n=1 Tax=Cervus canadensis TaxID=1574408 RepID=UPI001CA34848|nr:uncharacterized protein LOC122421649 isoform X1 [Cervus canadensis]